jgi:uncharacterized protein YcbX
MVVGELWRYPVKSLRGEQLEAAVVHHSGIFGDRLVHARHPGGRVVTARTHPGLLGLRGTIGPDGEPLIEGLPWNDPRSLGAVRRAAGAPVDLVRFEAPDIGQRFDVLPLSILTDGAIAALGVDRRRLRPNIFITGIDGLAERTWPGRTLQMGDVLVEVRNLRSRCVMTTFDPDTLEQDVSVLRRIVQEFNSRIALDCAVVRGGTIHVGDPVELVAAKIGA